MPSCVLLKKYEERIREIIKFTKASKQNKTTKNNLGLNLTKDVKDFYKKSFKMLKKELRKIYDHGLVELASTRNSGPYML